MNEYDLSEVVTKKTVAGALYRNSYTPYNRCTDIKERGIV